MKNMTGILAFVFAASVFSAEYYVDASRPDNFGAATNWSTAKQTIQAAVDLTTDGDTVWVTNGVYDAGGAIAPAHMLSNRVCITNAITVQSINGAEVTIIKGAVGSNGGNDLDAVRGVYMSAGMLSGFTVTNGHTVWFSSFDLSNFLDTSGGGLNLCDGTGIVSNCVITGNSAGDYGGGGSCGGTLYNCKFFGNTAEFSGGGSRLSTLYNCTLSGNSSRVGGGSNQGILYNCTLFNNSAITGGGSYYDTLYNCVIWSNTATNNENDLYNSTAKHSCSLDLTNGIDGNITNAPLFMDLENGDLRLQADSLCINAGSNACVSGTTDLNGRDRIMNGTVDMGAYEYLTAYVSADTGNDANSGQSWTNAKQTIQAAVDLTSDGDMVLVTNGVYAAGGAVTPNATLTNRVCITNNITVRSVNGASETFIEGVGPIGSNAVRGGYLSGGATLSGFTVANGNTLNPDLSELQEDNCGGGVFIADGLLKDCIVDGNHALHSGGGLYCYRGGLVWQCLIKNNTSLWYGGGAGLFYGGLLESCTVYDNLAGIPGEPGMTKSGGGICMIDGELRNSIVWGNQADSGRDVFVRPDSVKADVVYSCMGTWSGQGVGNLTDDPLFVNASGGDFQLQSNSPCINAGHNSYVSESKDLVGDSRIIGGVVDMGAYERQNAGSDVDSDGMADLWEMEHLQSRHLADPDTTCANGLNTLRGAYIAGLDPNNPNSRFLAQLGTDQVLRWNAASGRVYSVWCSTNLMSGFQCLETNIPWTAGGFTGEVHSVGDQIFYKVDVHLDD